MWCKPCTRLIYLRRRWVAFYVFDATCDFETRRSRFLEELNWKPYTKGCNCMPRPKRDQSAPVTQNLRWVNYKLNSTELTQFDAWNFTLEDAIVETSNLVSQGYRVSCSWDAHSSAFQVSIIAPSSGNPNSGLALSSRSTDLGDALALSLYKHAKVFQGKWVAPAADPKSVRG